jgi:hypothetical protein
LLANHRIDNPHATDARSSYNHTRMLVGHSANNRGLLAKFVLPNTRQHLFGNVCWHNRNQFALIGNIQRIQAKQLACGANSIWNR